MADIHVLKGQRVGRGTRKVLKNYAFHFIIPVVDRVAEAAQDPDLVAFESIVPNITTTERDAIKAGEVVEELAQIPYNRTASNAAILVKVRAEYTVREPIVRIEYIEKYRHYLDTFTSS